MAVVDQQDIQLSVDGEPLTHVLGEGDFLTMDRRWTPYIQGRFTVEAPVDPTVLDPRTRPMLDVVLTQRFGSGVQLTSDLTALWAGQLTSDLTALWAGQLTSAISAYERGWYGDEIPATAMQVTVLVRRWRDNFDGTHTLTVEGIESMLRDYPLPNLGDFNVLGFTAATARGLYKVALAHWQLLFLGTPVLPLSAGPGDVAIPPGQLTDTPDATFAPVADKATLYTLLQPYLLIGNLRLWGDEWGRLQLTPVDEPTLDTIVLDAPKIMDGAPEVNIDDDLWADAVAIEFDESPISAARPRLFYYQSTSDPATKILRWKIDAPSPFIASNLDTLGPQIAVPVLERLLRRGRVVPVSAVNNFAARPGMTLVLEGMPDVPDQTGTIAAITWQIDDGSMTPR